MIFTIDTHNYVKKLQAVNIPALQAETQIEVNLSILNYFMSELATKQELWEVNGSLQQAIKAVDTSLKQSIKDVDISLKQSIKDVDISLRQSIKDVDTSLRQSIKDVDTSLRQSIQNVDVSLRHEIKLMETALRSDMRGYSRIIIVISGLMLVSNFLHTWLPQIHI